MDSYGSNSTLSKKYKAMGMGISSHDGSNDELFGSSLESFSSRNKGNHHK